jgi:hypothetical protein
VSIFDLPMKHSFLSAIKPNKANVGLALVLIASFFSGYSSPSINKSPVKTQTEWVSSKKEVKANSVHQLASTQPLRLTFSQHSDFFFELNQTRLLKVLFKSNHEAALPQKQIIFLLSGIFSQSFEEDSHAF